MLRFFPYILKTLWRHRARTLLTLSGAAAAIFVYCFVGAIQQGMHDLHNRREAKQTLVTFQANKFCPATSHLPQDYQQKIERLSSVKEAVPIQVFTNNCRASLDVIVFYGVEPEQLSHIRNFTLESGSWADFEQKQDAALVGRSVAKRRELKPGQTFSLGDLTVTIAGVYSSTDPAEENHIYSHLDFLQRGTGFGRVGTVTQLEVVLEEDANTQAVCEAIDATFHSGPVETNTRPKGVFQTASLGDLSQLVDLSYFVGIACLGLILAILAATTAISVQDRSSEHAVLQAIGYSGFHLFGLVMTETVLLSLVGGAIGVGSASFVLAASNLAVGAEAVTVAFRPSVPLAATCILASLLAGLAAGILPAAQAARVRIVAELRQ